ncbi:MAG: fumarylacetoacetate hydrolase family protein [Acidobacteria bacterium]|nr:fumarylacetoacetate hydrolase family protein [Acidobacteriota bacterium]
MRIARYFIQGKPIAGRLDGDRLWPFHDDFPAEIRQEGPSRPLVGAKLLSPCAPGKIVGIGLNYKDHARERGKALPLEPLLFLKPPSSVLAPGDPILLPQGAGRVDHEAELAIVIGRKARHLAVANAGGAILGYTCFNDVTARELQDRDGQFTRAKGFDTFAPLGPWIETELNPLDLSIEGRVNGDLRQSSSTRELIFSPAFLVSFVSRVMTLLPGDIIATGTPAGIGALSDGDTVEITIEGIGTLANPVRSGGI